MSSSVRVVLVYQWNNNYYYCHQSSNVFISFSVTAPIFISPHRANGKSATRRGDTTPYLDWVTFIMVHTHAIWATVKTVIVDRFTAWNFSSTTTPLNEDITKATDPTFRVSPCNNDVNRIRDTTKIFPTMRLFWYFRKQGLWSSYCHRTQQADQVVNGKAGDTVRFSIR